jgi:hypothetical protein
MALRFRGLLRIKKIKIKFLPENPKKQPFVGILKSDGRQPGIARVLNTCDWPWVLPTIKRGNSTLIWVFGLSGHPEPAHKKT